MKIVVVTDWISEKMGYSENALPKALARAGAQVHVVTSDLQPYFPNYKEAYEDFLGSRIQPAGTKKLNGFTLHRLVHASQSHGVRIRGFHREIASIRPDIVQVFTIPTWSTYQSVLSKVQLGFKLFLEEHTHASVLNLSWKGKLFFAGFRLTVGKMISGMSERCYAIAPDVAEIVEKYFGYSRNKIQIYSLGVDTDLFTSPRTQIQLQRRQTLRQEMGFSEQDIVCLYSGRFHQGKNPQCLARAIDLIQRTDQRFKALFLGAGSVVEIERLQQCKGCIVHPFVPYEELPDFYRAADLGVWPKQESTSQLDAAACGLPLILSDRIGTPDRADGNGLLYKEDDYEHLARQILRLGDRGLRRELGQTGERRMQTNYSWDRIARLRIADYESSLKGLALA
jgi:glycosyltransferase involved in cell wall biosynthesis